MPAYRVEMSISSRATCVETECKKHGVKIQKDDLRLGTWVEVEGYGNGSFKWKHWGCVTGKQLLNMRDNLDPHGSGNYEWDRLDGYDDEGKGGLVHAPHLQEKVRRVVNQGFIDPEDWKGDPEMNKLGEVGLRTAATKKRIREEDKARLAADEGDGQAGASDQDQTPVKAPAKTPVKKRVRSDLEDDADDEDTKKPAPKKKRATKAKKEEEDDVKPAPSKKGRKKTVKGEPSDKMNGLDAADEVKPKVGAKGRKKAVKEESSDEANELNVVEEVTSKVATKKGRKKTVKDESIDEEMNKSEKLKAVPTKPRKKAVKKEEAELEVNNRANDQEVKGKLVEMADPDDAPATAEEDAEIKKVKPKKKGGRSKNLNSATISDKPASRGSRSRIASKK